MKKKKLLGALRACNNNKKKAAEYLKISRRTIYNRLEKTWTAMKLKTITLQKVSYNYGTNPVLNDTTLEVNCGEIHAIVGEHGTGKSTIAHILSGFFSPKGGHLSVNGQFESKLSRKKARELGIYYVSQQNPLVTEFSVWENIILDEKSSVFPLQTRRGQKRKVIDFLASLDVEIDLDLSKPIKQLGLSDLVLVDILKALYIKPVSSDY